MDYTFHDYNDAVAETNAVYNIACAEAETFRDRVIAEARARLAGDNLRALIRQEERDYEIIE